ncbi:trehalose-phosphatase [Edaphobacter modestus]|uniref:Trehalose 6-phosphate phosphatase n=1 Tax=Edaphobacter modestus TaxID=388466 RepID=A0A4Q7YNZ5_9BACT|nr:trehalose-phosphatase [Edaphobacter modestus]RZU39088.1 trehalose 6-phosphatase [Edaphobacter modestus]
MPESSQINARTDFLNKLPGAPASVLLLDYDGTLAPFHVERDRAYPYPGILPLLGAIQQTGRTAVIVITGRPVEEVQALLQPLAGIEIWGAHGLDHLLPNGTREQVPIDPSLTHALQRAEEWLHSQGMSALAEVKPGGVAVHWRGMSEDQIQEIRSSTLQGWAPLAEPKGLKLLHFEGGIELRVTRPDKGDAVGAVLRDLDLSVPVAFLGDDLTDEDGFRKLAQRGLSILVRNEYRETAATSWLKPPQELTSFLEQWLRRTSIS